MVERRGSVTHRGLLWAGGLAAIPLTPTGAFGYQAGLPWEGPPTAPLPEFHADTAASFLDDIPTEMLPERLGKRAVQISVPLDPSGLLGRGNPFKG